MLHEFLSERRGQIVGLVRERMAARRAPRATDHELENGVPRFLEQLGVALERKTASSQSVADTSRAINDAAAQNAAKLFLDGFTVSQVVHGYGDVCQVVTGLALEVDAPVSNRDFQTLNLCLDEAIAGAVTEFARLHAESSARSGTERLGFLAHEIRNLLGSAIMSFDMLRAGTVPIAGSTGAILGRSLSRLHSLVDRSLAEVRLESGLKHDQRVAVAELIEEMEIVATAEAKVRGVHLEVSQCTPRPTVLGDRQILGSAIDNLVQNAIKFTQPNGRVTVMVKVEGTEHVVIDVADECGGLPAGQAERLFAPFKRGDKDQSGSASASRSAGAASAPWAARSRRGTFLAWDACSPSACRWCSSRRCESSRRLRDRPSSGCSRSRRRR